LTTEDRSKTLLDSILMAFSLYSRIPVPQAQWKEENMRWCICFLPLVGAVIGALQAAAFFVMTKKAACGALLRTSILTALPALLSGGIHLDGFMDPSDAINSFGDKEKRLQILKDPHVGSFAIIRLVTLMGLFLASVYMILYYSF
jgi:adenosylcobinamide-GDP ribazoletransferase